MICTLIVVCYRRQFLFYVHIIYVYILSSAERKIVLNDNVTMFYSGFISRGAI